MNLDAILLFPIIFMIHEFEEIIFVKAWAAKHQNNSAMKKQYWVVAFRKYPISTATFATLIAEEFVVISTLTILAAYGGFYAFFAGLLIAYAIHLVKHIWDVVRLRGYVPGGPSALLTLPIIIWMIHRIVVQTNSGLWQVAVWTAVIGVGLLLNLKMLYRLSPAIERLIR